MNCQICKASTDTAAVCDFNGVHVCEACIWGLRKALDEWPRTYVNAKPLKVSCTRCFNTSLHTLSEEYQCRKCGKDGFIAGTIEEEFLS